MTIAHMQGKFLLKACTHSSGHHIHEDAPDEVTKIIEEFIKTFRITVNFLEKQVKCDIENLDLQLPDN